MTDRSDRDHSRVIDHALLPPAGTFDLDPAHTFVTFSGPTLGGGPGPWPRRLLAGRRASRDGYRRWDSSSNAYNASVECA